jgi:hypothetical protein
MSNFGRGDILFFISLRLSKLNPKQEYPNLSNKGKSAPVRVIVACQKTFSKNLVSLLMPSIRKELKPLARESFIGANFD